MRQPSQNRSLVLHDARGLEASSTKTEYATYSAKCMTSRDTVWVVHSLRWQPDQIRPVDLAKVMEELAGVIRDARKTVVVLARE